MGDGGGVAASRLFDNKDNREVLDHQGNNKDNAVRHKSGWDEGKYK